MRVLLYTGKGGVGKTTIAAATAVKAAELGYRTIVLSTDTAHSLGDSFDIPLSGEPKLIAPNLWGQETDICKTMETQWVGIQDWMVTLMAWQGMDGIKADEMAVFPGMEDLANLLYIVNYYDSGDYDLIIIDCAPTGEMLRFLSYPEVLQWYMDKIFPIHKKAAVVARPIVKHVLGMPMPDDEVFQSTERLFRQLSRMQTLLSDPEIASVRLVVNPEKMVIKEAQRSYTYLSLYGYATDLVICNRLIPEKVDDRYFESWKESQSKYYQMIEESFTPIPILSIPLLEQEVVGLGMLHLVAEEIYGDRDPTEVFFRGQAQGIEKENGCYMLTLRLPFITKGDISLLKNGDELIIQVANYKRNIILPHTLASLTVKEAKFEEEKLRIRFEQES